MIPREPGVPVRREAELLDLSWQCVNFSAAVAGAGEPRGWSPARDDVDASDGHRGTVSMAARQPHGTGRGDLPLSAVRSCGQATEPGVGI